MMGNLVYCSYQYHLAVYRYMVAASNLPLHDKGIVFRLSAIASSIWRLFVLAWPVQMKSATTCCRLSVSGLPMPSRRRRNSGRRTIRQLGAAEWQVELIVYN